MGNVVKNQHYIPQENVLRHFSLDEKVYESLVDQKKEPYLTSYRNSMSERFVYEHPDLEVNELEKMFDVFEATFSPGVLKLLSALEEIESEHCDFVDAKTIVEQFLDIMIIYYYRSGALLHEFSFETKRKEDRVSMLLMKILNSKYIQKLGDTIRNYYSFAVIKSENHDFLLSDQYISTVALGIKSRFADISNRHIGLKDVMLLIPVSSKYYIAYFNGKKPDYIQAGRINLLSEHQVQEINKVIVNNSYVKCVARNKEALAAALPSFRFKSPSATYFGHNSGRVSGSTLKKEIFYYERDERAFEIFTEPSQFIRFKDLGRNEVCGCGSGKKFKRCCYDYFETVKEIWQTIGDKGLGSKVVPHPRAVIEQSIFSF